MPEACALEIHSSKVISACLTGRSDTSGMSSFTAAKPAATNSSRERYRR